MRNLIKKEGFEFYFDQNGCFSCEGNCCTGESGYIWVDKEEIKNIADFLKIDIEDFKKDFLKKEKYRYTIKEVKIKKEYHCIFFNKGCQIYPVRPKQCKTYPFWERYKDKKNLDEVIKECPAIILKK